MNNRWFFLCTCTFLWFRKMLVDAPVIILLLILRAVEMIGIRPRHCFHKKMPFQAWIKLSASLYNAYVTIIDTYVDCPFFICKCTLSWMKMKHNALTRCILAHVSVTCQNWTTINPPPPKKKKLKHKVFLIL